MSMLDKLINHPEFGIYAKDVDVGIMIYKNEDVLNYLTLTYDDHYEVFLSLYDDERDYLVVGKSDDLDDAKQLAVAELDKKINKPIH